MYRSETDMRRALKATANPGAYSALCLSLITMEIN